MPMMCFSYPADISGRDVAQRALRDSRRMPYSCFRY